MPIIAHSFLLGREPLRKSWWSMDIASSPVGPMPMDEGFKLRSMPQWGMGVETQRITNVNGAVSIPHHRDPVSGALAFHIYGERDDRTFEWWKAWMKLVYDEETDDIGLHGDIVGQGVVTLYVPGRSTSSEPEAARTFQIVDLWPSAVILGGLDQASDGEPLDYEIRIEATEVRL